jgi:hypothetical protein
MRVNWEFSINQYHNDVLKLEKSKSNHIFKKLTLYSISIIF